MTNVSAPAAEVKITNVEPIVIEIPLSKVFGGSKYRVASRWTVVTRIHTDAGLVSQVYNGDNREHSPVIAAIIANELAPLIAGESIFAIERLWKRMFKLTEDIRNRPHLMEAISCVDTALWDLFGKAAGMNVATLLGGYRSELPLVSIGGYYVEGKTLADISREMETYRAAGMGGCKFKVGGLSPEEDARRVAAARKGGGDDFILSVDANRAWDVADAARFAKLIEPYDIAWFEEPCLWFDDARLMAELRPRTSIPLAAGQSEITSHGVRRLLEAGALDFVNVDASECGGVTEWRRAAQMAQVRGVRMIHHEEPQIALQLLGGIPHGFCAECFADPERDPIWQSMILNRAPIKDGVVQVPQGPGFGLELDWGMIERYRKN